MSYSYWFCMGCFFTHTLSSEGVFSISWLAAIFIMGEAIACWPFGSKTKQRHPPFHNQHQIQKN